MALKNIDLQVILIALCFTIAEGTRKRSKYPNSQYITFSPEVADILIIGYLTALFLLYWFILRPLFEERPEGWRSRHNRLNKFLMDFWKNDVLLKPSCGSKEYKDISSSIQSLVEDIIVKVFSCKDSSLVIKRENVSKHVELVGSCKERSKIQRPDEFDFSIKFPAFSADNVFVEHGSSIRPDEFKCIHKNLLHDYDNAFVQLRYTGSIDKESQLFRLLMEVNNHYYISAFEMHRFFKIRIRSVVKQMVSDNHSKKCSTGKLVVKIPDEVRSKSEENGPAWKLPLFWDSYYGKGYIINVDIAPVISISDQFSAISIRTFNKNVSATRFMSYPAICYMLGNEKNEYKSDIEKMQGGIYTYTYEEVIKRVSDKNKLYVELSFLTSHVHHEITLMKELKNSFNNLFKTYQIFKRLEPMWTKIDVNGKLHGLRFHSYVLKTIILDEIIHRTKRISRHDDVATYFIVILTRIEALYESFFYGHHISLTSLWFDEHILTCAQLPQVSMYDDEYAYAFRQQFKGLFNLLNRVEGDDAYEYHKYEQVILDLIPANFSITKYTRI